MNRRIFKIYRMQEVSLGYAVKIIFRRRLKVFLLSSFLDLPPPQPKRTGKLYPRNRGKKVYRLHTAFLHWPLSSAATKKVQGPDTT